MIVLTGFIKIQKPEEEELTQRLKAARSRLKMQQLMIKEQVLPVLVLMEGWGAAGKGSTIGKIIRNIDPRFFNVVSLSAPSEEEKRRPFLYRYFTRIPEQGKFTFLDSGWMDEVVADCLENRLSEEGYADRIESIHHFERQLTDNGYLVMKFFFHIEEKEQRKRLKELESSQDTQWRVSAHDKWQNRNYDRCMKTFDRYLKDTHTSAAPWYIVDAQSFKWAQLQVLETLSQGIDIALRNRRLAVPLLQNVFALKPVSELSEIDIDKAVEEKEYKEELQQLQDRLSLLHNRLYQRRVPVVIVYEGWDAAGKGGNIRRLTEALDPRGFEVQPIASPEPHEKARHYLWRFWSKLPKTGHITIFDRSWYGRVMVERIEGFCKENDWQRAYNEINEFEKELYDWGAVVIKFWVHIDRDTQLERFTLRQNIPEKQWKITEEDWRNREKWDSYETAVNEMLQKTSTEFAAWRILESVDKKYARLKALRIVVEELEKRLGR